MALRSGPRLPDNAPVTQEQLRAALSIMREHTQISLRIVMAGGRGDTAMIEALANRLAELDHELEERFGVAPGDHSLH